MTLHAQCTREDQSLRLVRCDGLCTNTVESKYRLQIYNNTTIESKFPIEYYPPIKSPLQYEFPKGSCQISVRFDRKSPKLYVFMVESRIKKENNTM